VEILKTNLTNRIKSVIRNSEKNIRLYRNIILPALKKTDLNNATYAVNLISLWEDQGEKPVRIKHKGTLEEAIKIAESDFKKVNNRGDVQAVYSVSLILGKRGKVPIFDEYWKMYKESREPGCGCNI